MSHRSAVTTAAPTASMNPDSASSLLRTLVLCDLVDSTALVERLGDRGAAELIRKHDRLARAIADGHGGREIDKADGFLMMFERPIQAVAFALEYLRGLRQLNAVEDSNLRARVGIHVGDVVVWNNSSADISRGAKPLEVEGLVKLVAARLTNLALPGQILMSNVTSALAHRAMAELGERVDTVRWRNHGSYRFQGIVESIAVFEVGELEYAPLRAPAWSSTGHREVPIWRRPLRIAIQAAAILALVLVPVYVMVRPEPAIAFVNRDWVVVGDLNNLTADPMFDETLQAAFRIGLEQSRHINVMPDLKVRQTLAHMQRDPETTRVDRALGSEIALRDGARAVILPTVAEIGGRVRVIAEVIDPHTQATVYSESADGLGAQSVVASLDSLTVRLRSRLGEALASVSGESESLARVATANLDALRAYSLASRASTKGHSPEAIALYQNAITLDGDFALARVKLAQEYFNIDLRAEALEQITLALDHQERMSTRDTLYAQAWLSNFGSPRAALDKWTAVASMYPDMFGAQGAAGYYAWKYGNDFPKALKAIEQIAVPQNANKGLSMYLLGTLKLGQERYAEALAAFDEAESLEVNFQKGFHASVYAAQRNHVKADAVLAQGQPAEVGNDEVGNRILRATLALDRGDWVGLRQQVERLQDVSSITAMHARQLEATALSLAMTTAAPAERAALISHIPRGITAKPVRDATFEPVEWNANLLLRAWLAYLIGEPEIAQSMLALTTPEVSNPEYPTLDRLNTLVQAEAARHAGNLHQAQALLEPMLDGTEPYITHLSLMFVYANQRDFTAAREQAIWLTHHRGRAYAEVSNGHMFISYNVGISNLAELYNAQLSWRLGEIGVAKDALQRLRTIWPDDGRPQWISAEIDALTQTLASPAAPPAP